MYITNSAGVFSNVDKFLQIFPFYRVPIELPDVENLFSGLKACFTKPFLLNVKFLLKVGRIWFGGAVASNLVSQVVTHFIKCRQYITQHLPCLHLLSAK